MPVCRRVLLANLDEAIRNPMADALVTQGFIVGTARSGGQCLFMLQEQDYDGILIERDLGDLNAEQLLEQARRENPQLAVIVVSTNGGTQQAVRLAKLGSDDYLPAADSPDRIARRLIEVIEERCSKSSDGGEGHLVGRSRAMQRVWETIRMIAPKRSTVLITGPTEIGRAS